MNDAFKMIMARMVTEPKLILKIPYELFLRTKRIPGIIAGNLKENKRYFTEKRNYDCSKLRIAVINHYHNENVNVEAHAKKLVDKLNDIEVEYVGYYKPDVVFCYVYGNKRKIDKHKKAAKIFFTGEAVEFLYSQYDGYHLQDNGYDISTGFKFETENTALSYLRLPLGVLYYFETNYTREQISEKIDEIEMTARRYGDNRSKFCAMINSHDRFQTREKIYHAVSQVNRVDCPGKLYHNDNTLKADFDDNKIDYLRQYRFNICAENTITEGYCTEKVFDALYAGCIPIYTGGDNVDPEPGVLNPEKIIFFNHENIDDSVISQVKKLHENAGEYKAWINRPIFCDTATDVIHTMFTRYNEMLAELATGLEEKIKKG